MSGVRTLSFTAHCLSLRYPLVNKTQLYDLQADPHEMTDPADKPESAAKIAELTPHTFAQKLSASFLPLSFSLLVAAFGEVKPDTSANPPPK